MQVANKTIIVTGAGSGIGRELSIQLLSKNANIIGVDIHENALAETQKIAGVGNDRFIGKCANICTQTKPYKIKRANLCTFNRN